MEAALAKLLVEEGGIPADRLDEAVRRVAQHGGRVDTYLLELGLIDEARLTELMARAYGVPAADFRALVKVDLQALRLLPSRVAERCQVFPFQLEGNDLHVLSPGPPDLVLLEEIGELVSRNVVPHVATEYRIARALSHFYGLAIPARYANLELALQGRPPANAAAAQPAIPVERRSPDAQAPRWPLDTALARLASARDRDAVLDVALTYARGFADCAAALGVHAGQVVGWQARGVRAEHEALHALALSLDEPSALRTVIETTAPYLGKFGAGPVHDALLGAMGRARPRSVLLYPVLVAGRVIAILYADNGKRALRTADLADLLAFCARVGAAFENVILARKRESAPAIPPPAVAAEEAVAEAEPGPAATDDATSAPAADEEPEPAPRVFTVQVDVDASAPAMSIVEEPEPVDAAPAPAAAATVSTPPHAEEVPADELASWDDEVAATLGTAGQRPRVAASSVDLASMLSEDEDLHPDEEDVVLATGEDAALDFGDETGFESGERSLPIRQLDLAEALQRAMAEASSAVTGVEDAGADADPPGAPGAATAESAGSVDAAAELAAVATLAEPEAPSPAQAVAADARDVDAAPATPDRADAARGGGEAESAGDRRLNGAEDGGDASRQVDDLDDLDDDERDDEESVVLEDLEGHAGTAPWREALAEAVETGRQGGEVAPPAGSVLHTASEHVAFSEVVSEVVAKPASSPVIAPAAPVADALELGTPRSVEAADGSLELGTPRPAEPAAAEPAGFSLADLNRLCERLAGPDSPAARAAMRELLRADLRLIPMLTARFPGRVSYDPFAQDWSIPEPEDLSPLIALLVARPDIGAEVALAHLDSSFPALRWFAVYLFRHVHDGRAIKSILSRLHDEEPRIRHLTAEVLKGYSADVGFETVIKHLRSRLQSPVAEVRRRAIYFLGFFKDVSSVPHLVGCLSAREPELVQEAVQALAAVTLQTLGTSQRKWLKWWQKNQARSRVEWLIDGLRHKDRNIRYAASIELTSIARETFGYDHDARKRDRDKAIKGWERWWKTEKKRMHIEA